VVVGLGVLLAVNLGGDPTKVSNATVGHLAPDFRLTSFDHKSIDLSQLRGRVVPMDLPGLPALPVVASYHPAYLLRNPADKARAWADLCLAAEQA